MQNVACLKMYLWNTKKTSTLHHHTQRLQKCCMLQNVSVKHKKDLRLTTPHSKITEMLHVAKCICEIQKRPPLYNTTLKDYRNVACWKMYLWNTKKTSALQHHTQRLQQSTIKSQVLDGQPEPKKKRYVYFDQLQFLLPLICDGKESWWWVW